MSSVPQNGERNRRLRRMSAFRRSDDGAVTVEFVLWFPFFILILAIITDFTMIYMTNSSMWAVARQATRAMSVRAVTAAEARAMIEETLIRGGVYQIKIDLDASSEEVSALIRMSVDDASVFGILTPFMNDDIVAAVRMQKEPL